MDDNLKILKEIGAHKIHNETHISREFIQSLIHESFDELQSVQFFGFVSIIEKTYDVDLSSLKARAREHFKTTETTPLESKKVFVVPDRQKSSSVPYILLGIIIVFSLAYYSFVYVNSIEFNVEVIDNTTIEDAQKNIQKVKMKEPVLVLDTEEEITTVDENISQTEDTNLTEQEVEVAEEVKPEVVEVVRTLKILPKRKIWAGYINIATNQKYQKVFKQPFSIETDKDWLLLFGSGTAKLEVNGEVKTFSSKQNMRFKYVNGKFSKITVTEFKMLNRGRKW